MGENAAIAAGRPAAAGSAATASSLLKLLLLGLNHGHLLLASVAADRLLDRHHLVWLRFVGRPQPVR